MCVWAHCTLWGSEGNLRCWSSTFHLDFAIMFLGFVVSLLCKPSQQLPKAYRILLSLFLISLWELWDYGCLLLFPVLCKFWKFKLGSSYLHSLIHQAIVSGECLFFQMYWLFFHILHPDYSFPSFHFSQLLSQPSFSPRSTPLFSFRKGQTSQWHQMNTAWHVTIRPGTNPHIRILMF